MHDVETADRDTWWSGLLAVQVVGHSAYGGGVPIIFAIMEATASVGLKPLLLATHPDVVEAARGAGFDVWEFEGIVREPHPLRDFVVAVWLARALRARGVKIVHTHTSKGGMVGRLGAWLAGCPLIVHHTHGFYHVGLPPGLRRFAMETLERAFAHMSDYQVFLSECEATLAVERRIVPEEKVRVIPNGIRIAGWPCA